MDYGTFRNLVGTLAGNFWALIEHQNPGIDTLHLPHEVAETWKQGLRVITDKDGSTRPRKDYFDLLLRVRAFYLDIREWALDDPSWALWVVPCPVRRGEIVGMTKAKKTTTAAMHQRIRERLPHLPVLVDTAERIRAEQATLLATATKTPVGMTFNHGGRGFRRVAPKAYRDRQQTFGDRPPIQVEDLATGEVLDVERAEDEAFWAWAVIETLRHTGVRVEELTEITHLALISYRLPSTGEVVPMLQIVPSKSNEERLLLISPELASVLATIITRLRNQNNGTVALTARYDSTRRSPAHRCRTCSNAATAGNGTYSATGRSRNCSTKPSPTRTCATPPANPCTTPRTTSAGSSPPSRSPADYRSTSWRDYSVTPPSTPPRLTWRCSTKTWSETTGHSSTNAAATDQKPSTGNRPSRNGSSSSNTSKPASSSSANAAGPMARLASMSTPASGAPSSGSTPAQPRLVQIIPTSRTASRRPTERMARRGPRPDKQPGSSDEETCQPRPDDRPETYESGQSRDADHHHHRLNKPMPAGTTHACSHFPRSWCDPPVIRAWLGVCALQPGTLRA